MSEPEKKHSVISPHYWLEKHGLSKRDVPRALVYFKTISYVSWFATLGLCYRFQPSKSLRSVQLYRNMTARLQARYPATYNKYTTFVATKTRQLGNNKYFRKIPETIGLKSKRFSRAFVENLVLNKLALPITIPSYIYLSAKMVERRKKKRAKRSQETSRETVSTPSKKVNGSPKGEPSKRADGSSKGGPSKGEPSKQASGPSKGEPSKRAGGPSKAEPSRRTGDSSRERVVHDGDATRSLSVGDRES
jgi:hypothetical protein